MAKLITVVVLVLALTGLAKAELLANPGFEDNGGSIDGWSRWSGGSGSGSGGYFSIGDIAEVVVHNDGTAHSGEAYVSQVISFDNDMSGWGWGVSLLFQDLPVTTGDTYTLATWVRDALADGSNLTVPTLLTFEQRWDDGSGGRPPEVDLDGNGQNDRINVTFDIPKDGQWHYTSVTHTIPDGVNFITAVLSTAVQNNHIDYDDVSLTPEPATLALLGLGGLLLRRRR